MHKTPPPEGARRLSDEEKYAIISKVKRDMMFSPNTKYLHGVNDWRTNIGGKREVENKRGITQGFCYEKPIAGSTDWGCNVFMSEDVITWMTPEEFAKYGEDFVTPEEIREVKSTKPIFLN